MVKGKKQDVMSDDDNQFEDALPTTQTSQHSELIKTLSANPETAERYKLFKHSKIDYKRLKKFVENKFDVDLTLPSALVMATTSKMFCGDVVERARELMTANKVAGPITTTYLKQAYRDVIQNFKGPLFAKYNT